RHVLLRDDLGRDFAKHAVAASVVRMMMRVEHPIDRAPFAARQTVETDGGGIRVLRIDDDHRLRRGEPADRTAAPGEVADVAANCLKGGFRRRCGGSRLLCQEAAGRYYQQSG